MYTRIQGSIALCENQSRLDLKWADKIGLYLEDSKNKGTGGFLFYENGEFCFGNGILQTLPKNIQVDKQRGIVIGSKLKPELPGSVILGEDCGEELTFGTDLLFFGRGVGRGIIEANNLLAAGAGAMKSASAIGDSIALGTESMGDCDVTELNLAMGQRSLYRVAGNYNIGIGIKAAEGLSNALSNSNSMIGREVMRECSGTFIDILIQGSKAGEKMEGNHFESVYMGNHAAAKMKASIVAIHNLGLGSHVLEEATNVSESVVAGAYAGNKGAGIRATVIGPRAASEMSGFWSGDVIIGDRAGAFRYYFESSEVIIGSEAGMSGSGVFNNMMGKLAGAGMNGANNNLMGSSAGQDMTGDDNVAIAAFAGQGASGSRNILAGKGQGRGLIGSGNILVGEGPEICEHLDNTIGIGNKLRLRGKNGIALGEGCFSGASGKIDGDIGIGLFAGQNQNFGNEPKKILVMGNFAGAAYPNIPDGVDSFDVAIFGHDAGRTENQIFQHAALFGNSAGSFASRIIRSAVFGPRAGIGMDGEDCCYVGHQAGFNVKGDRNILIGNLGEKVSVLNDTLGIGIDNPVIQADLQKGNVLTGKDKLRTGWSDGQNGLGLVEGKAPKNLDSDLAVLTFENEHLVLSAKERKTVLSYPYKFVYDGEVTGLKYRLNTSIDGTTCVSYKFIPHSKLEYYATGELLLHVENKVITVSPLNNPKWKVEFADDVMILSAPGIGKAIVYFEVYGQHIVEKID